MSGLDKNGESGLDKMSEDARFLRALLPAMEENPCSVCGLMDWQKPTPGAIAEMKANGSYRPCPKCMSDPIVYKMSALPMQVARSMAAKLNLPRKIIATPEGLRGTPDGSVVHILGGEGQRTTDRDRDALRNLDPVECEIIWHGADEVFGVERP